METWRCVWVVVWAWIAATHAAHDKRNLLRDLDRPGRIVGGYEVQPGQYPWQVSIQDGRGHFCGGTLISPSVVVTAAHCSRTIANLQSVRVITGAHDLMARDVNREYKVVRVIQGDYNAGTMVNDIALLQLDTTDSNQAAQRGTGGIPVSLNSRKESSDGRNCSVSGWGKLLSGSNDALPHVLRAAEVVIKTDEQCERDFSKTQYRVYPSNVCAGGGERDACQGDSGGPLVCYTKGSRTAEDVESCCLTGITSWGIGCATWGIPGVYTEVSHHVPWIKDQVRAYVGEEEARAIKTCDLEN